MQGAPCKIVASIHKVQLLVINFIWVTLHYHRESIVNNLKVCQERSLVHVVSSRAIYDTQYDNLVFKRHMGILI